MAAQALALADASGDQMAPWLVRVQLQCTLEAQGRFAEVDRDALVEQAKASAEPWSWLSYVAYLDAELGDTDRARRALRELVADGGAKLPRGLNWHVLAYIGETAATVGDLEAADLLYTALEPHARLFPVVARGGICIGSIQHALARLAHALGRPDEAELRLRRAITENLRIGARPRATIALARLGELLLERGEVERGRETLREAAAQADALDMTGVASRARKVARGGLAVAA